MTIGKRDGQRDLSAGPYAISLILAGVTPTALASAVDDSANRRTLYPSASFPASLQRKLPITYQNT